MKRLICITLLLCGMMSSPLLNAEVGDTLESVYGGNDELNYQFEVTSEEEKTCKGIKVVTEPNPSIKYYEFYDYRFSVLDNDREMHGYVMREIGDGFISDPDKKYNVRLFMINTTQKIGDYAFYSADFKRYIDNANPHLGYLGAVMIMSEVESIGQYAFCNTDISYIDLSMHKVPEVYENTFNEWTYENSKLWVYFKLEEEYRRHPVWSKFKHIYLSSGNGAEDIERDEKFTVVVEGRSIRVGGLVADSRVAVYDISGRCIRSYADYTESDLTIDIDTPGVYILRVNNEIKKVIIR